MGSDCRTKRTFRPTGRARSPPLVVRCRNNCGVATVRAVSTVRGVSPGNLLARHLEADALPGPSPLYQPRFPAEFLIQARLLSRQRTAKAHLRQRALLVLLLHQQPNVSNVAAATEVGLHPNSV